MSSYVKIMLMCILCMLFIVAYGTYRCRTSSFKDPLTKSIGPRFLEKYLDGWGISHFVFYGTLAYLFPRKMQLVFIACLGIAWEIIESIFKEHPFYFSDCKYEIPTDKDVGWWYGRWEDIVMNSLGMLTGVFLRRGKLF